MPVCTLLGGHFQDDILLYRAISQGSPSEMADLVRKYKTMVHFCYLMMKAHVYLLSWLILAIFQGYTRFQLKLGGDFTEDIERIKACHAILGPKDVLIGDANTGNLANCSE